jgi:hypothetical protein
VVRKRLGKSVLSSTVEDAVRRVIDLGYFVRASIGIGWPGETENDVIETLAMIDRLPRLLFDAYRYHPLPGVPLTRYWRRQHGRSAPPVEEEALEDFSVYNGNYSAIPGERFEWYWDQMVARQNQRYALHLPLAAR